MRATIKAAAVALAVVLYVWFAAVGYADDVRARKARRRGART